jgi:hypothetical protein
MLFAKYGTDGCDYIFKDSATVVPCVNFVSMQVEHMRQQAIIDKNKANEYQIWLNMVLEQLPTIHHFSWYSIEAKILKFKYFWNNSWLSLYNEQKPAGWNPFFENKSITDVSEQEIKSLAKKLEMETGGHIFHKPWPGTSINHITIEKQIPEIMNKWCKNVR